MPALRVAWGAPAPRLPTARGGDAWRFQPGQGQEHEPLVRGAGTGRNPCENKAPRHLHTPGAEHRVPPQCPRRGRVCPPARRQTPGGRKGGAHGGGCARRGNTEPERPSHSTHGAAPRDPRAPPWPLSPKLARAGGAAPRTRVGRGAPLRKARPAAAGGRPAPQPRQQLPAV